jgi:hypothetical protein
MVIDNNSTNPVKYVDSSLYVSGKGPNRWFAPTTIAHQEMWGPAAYGLNRSFSAAEPTPEPTIVQYEICESTDQGALQVVSDEMDPVPAGKIKISVVKAGGLTNVKVGDYVRAID